MTTNPRRFLSSRLSLFFQSALARVEHGFTHPSVGFPNRKNRPFFNPESSSCPIRSGNPIFPSANRAFQITIRALLDQALIREKSPISNGRQEMMKKRGGYARVSRLG